MYLYTTYKLAYINFRTDWYVDTTQIQYEHSNYWMYASFEHVYFRVLCGFVGLIRHLFYRFYHLPKKAYIADTLKILHFPSVYLSVGQTNNTQQKKINFRIVDIFLVFGQQSGFHNNRKVLLNGAAKYFTKERSQFRHCFCSSSSS